MVTDMSTRPHDQLVLERADLLAVRELGPWLAQSLESMLGAEVANLQVGRIELALHEMCINIVEHAYEGSGGPITISVERNPGTVHFTIQDSGKQFDPATVNEPDPDNPQVRGYGLMITRQLTSQLRYSNDDSHNRWDLTFDVDSFAQ